MTPHLKPKLLYHYTSVGSDNILAAGLKANFNGDYELVLNLPACVWLTAEPECRFFYKPPQTRIAVEIPPQGKRYLHHWPKYWKKHTNLPLELLEAEVGRRSMQFWWLYFGDIPLEWLRAVETYVYTVTWVTP